MRIFLILRLVLLVGILCKLSIPRTEILSYENPELSETQRWINQADSLFVANNLDSAIFVGKIALEKIEQEYGQSDSIYVHALRKVGALYHNNRNFAESMKYYEKIVKRTGQRLKTKGCVRS